MTLSVLVGIMLTVAQQIPDAAPGRDGVDGPPGIAVKVEAAGNLRGGEVIDADMVVSTLKLRVRNASIRVRLWKEDAVGDWLVVVTPRPEDRICVHVYSPGGEELLFSTFSTAGRRPADIAHTIALMVIEALSQAMPELVSRLPKEKTAKTIEAPPGPRAGDSVEPPAARWSASLGTSMAFLLPQSLQVWVVQADFARKSGLFVAGADAAWWSPVEGSGGDYRLHIWQGTARLSVGVDWELPQGRFSATLGPVLRLVAIDGSGADINPEQRLFVDGGIGLRLGASLGAKVVRPGLSLDLLYYPRYPRFIVDGRQALDMGHTAVGLSLWLSYDFVP